MPQKKRKITLIVPAEFTGTYEAEDRAGGETHGLKEIKETIKGWFTVDQTIDASEVKKNIKKCLEEVNLLIKDIKYEEVDGWAPEGISVALAISSEGSIGIATAGVEASFEISFSRKKPSTAG
jgi:hypothetical protein